MTLLKAGFLMIMKKQQVTNILVREDRRVWINFGSDMWIDFLKIKETENLVPDTSKNRKYLDWINSKKFQKDYQETLNVINNSEDWNMIIEKFVKDFKKDRGNRIIRQDLEVDTEKEINDLQELKK